MSLYFVMEGLVNHEGAQLVEGRGHIIHHSNHIAKILNAGEMELRRVEDVYCVEHGGKRYHVMYCYHFGIRWYRFFPKPKVKWVKPCSCDGLIPECVADAVSDYLNDDESSPIELSSK